MQMTRLIILALLLSLLAGNPALAKDLDKDGYDAYGRGLSAFNKGDHAAALRELQPLAEQGDPMSQFWMGYIYSDEKGVPQNYKTAVKWYKLAAEQGLDRAQSALGIMYLKGHGVLQDYTRAHMWWNIAASSGYKIASKRMGIVERKMTPSQIEKAQDLARECVRKDYKGC